MSTTARSIKSTASSPKSSPRSPATTARKNDDILSTAPSIPEIKQKPVFANAEHHPSIPMLPRDVINVHRFVTETVNVNPQLQPTSKSYEKSMKEIEQQESYFQRNLEQEGDYYEGKHFSRIPKPQKIEDEKIEKDVSQESDEDSEEEDAGATLSKLLSLHKRLPPSNIEMIPFNLFHEYLEEKNLDDLDEGFPTLPKYQISTREDFERLKRKTTLYIENLQNQLDDLYNKNPNEYTVYYSRNRDWTQAGKKRSGSQTKRKEDIAEQPTTIVFLNALQKASSIIEEVDRSRLESKLKANMFNEERNSFMKGF
jgi:hypothetical protein